MEKLAFGEISGFGTTATKIDMENMDGKLYCAVLQHHLEAFHGTTPKKIKYFF